MHGRHIVCIHTTCWDSFLYLFTFLTNAVNTADAFHFATDTDDGDG